MIRIWKEGGSMERVGVVMCAASIALCFVDIVDFEALPKTLDRLVVSFPLMVLAWIFILGGQRLRHRAEDRKRKR